jgi:hypothetical protein
MSDPGNESLDEALREAGRLESEKASFDEQFAAYLLPAFKKVGETFGKGKQYRFSTEFKPEEDGSVTVWNSTLIVVTPSNSKA